MNNETDKFCTRMIRRMGMAIVVGGTALGAAFITGEPGFGLVSTIALVIAGLFGFGLAGVFGGEILDMRLDEALKKKEE